MLAADDSANLGVRHYFQQELRRLREDAAEFAVRYPSIAQELALSRGKSADPQVELLIQSFAFLVGQMQYELDADAASVPNALLEQLYPHLTAPIPSMVVAQIEVKSDGANFEKGWTLARGRQLFATAIGDDGRQVPCRFQVCYHTPLLPLTVTSCGLVSTKEFDFLSDRRDVYSVLRVRMEAARGLAIHALPLDPLRFHLHGEGVDTPRLYETLSLHLVGLAVMVPGDQPAPRFLAKEAVKWLGFEPEHAVLPDRSDGTPAYRLLQEYSTFPEKFLFFDIEGLGHDSATSELDVLFLLDVADSSLRMQKGALRLNCVPLINLYPRPFEPLHLDHRQYEYRLVGDQTAYAHCEIHSLEEVRALRADAPPRTVAPYFAMEEHGKLERRDYFYATRRAVSQSRPVAGTEMYISLLDTQLEPASPARETLSGRALCTNRRLPEQLRAGDALMLEGPGPVNAARLLGKPTPHRTPRLLGSHPWWLVSQLSLNHLSLVPHGLNALKRILQLHVLHGGQRGWKEIDSLAALDSAPVVHHVGFDHWRGFCRGIAVQVVVDEERFGGGSVLLFGSVLRYFLAAYANLNSFTQLTLKSAQRKEEIRTWPPLAGTQIIL
jgi:type VI secretion system protein ImpG